MKRFLSVTCPGGSRRRTRLPGRPPYFQNCYLLRSLRRLNSLSLLPGAGRKVAGRRGKPMRRASLIAMIMLLPAVLSACGPGNKQAPERLSARSPAALRVPRSAARKPRCRRRCHRRRGGGHCRQRDRPADGRARPPDGGCGRVPGARIWSAGRPDSLGQSRQLSIAARSCPASPTSQGSQFCRPYTHTIYIGGQPQTARGTACRRARRHLEDD